MKCLIVIGGFLAVLCCLSVSKLSQSVVVDGSKKKDVSATLKQSNEKSMIDSFNTKTCGISDPNFDEHEFVNMAREGQFPWTVSFQIRVPHGVNKEEIEKSAVKSIKQTRAEHHGRLQDLHFCCGSFISDRWILSAAHCFAPKAIKNYLESDKLKIVAGSHKVSSRAPINRNLTIKRIFYHSRFDPSMPVGFDIALVELNEKVEFSLKRSSSPLGEQNKPFMNTICLPLRDKKYQNNETARVAGWGLSREKDATSTPSKLLTTDILLDVKGDCVSRYAKHLKSNRPKEQKKKYDDFICAGYKNTRDACQSDSGGPLIQYANGRAVAIGIVSYGIGCATKGVPGLYTRTSAYINWIRDIIDNGEGASTSFNLIEARAKDKSTRNEFRSSTTTKRPNTSNNHMSTTTTSTRPRTISDLPTEYSTTTTTRSPQVSDDFKFFDQ